MSEHFFLLAALANAWSYVAYMYISTPKLNLTLASTYEHLDPATFNPWPQTLESSPHPYVCLIPWNLVFFQKEKLFYVCNIAKQGIFSVQIFRLNFQPKIFENVGVFHWNHSLLAGLHLRPTKWYSFVQMFICRAVVEVETSLLCCMKQPQTADFWQVHVGFRFHRKMSLCTWHTPLMHDQSQQKCRKDNAAQYATLQSNPRFTFREPVFLDQKLHIQCWPRQRRITWSRFASFRGHPRSRTLSQGAESISLAK